MAGGPAEDNPVGINVTALVDIIFCLCLFFMCSLKFKELDGKMDSWLPKDKGGNPGPATNEIKDEMRVVMSYDETKKELQRLYAQRGIENSSAGDLLLKSLIRKDFDHYRSLGKLDVPVIIDAGERVPWVHIVNVMNMCKGEGINKIEFGFGSAVPSVSSIPTKQ